MRTLFSSLLIILGSLNVLEATPKPETEQINVRLSTENQLMPLYLARFVDDNSGFDKSYLETLEEVLEFDLNHNGVTYTMPHIAQREKLANGLATGDTVSIRAWQGMNVYYVVKVNVEKNKELSTLMLSVNAASIKTLGGISVTGDLSKDRRVIHQLADAIHKALFGTDGIATTKILYTVKKKGAGSSWTSDIWEADYDGDNARPVVKDGSYNINPVYIPPKAGFSSGSFFYVGYKEAQPKIFVATLKEGKGRRLTYLSGNQLMPAVSRQRDKIAFISDVTGNPDLFLQKFSPAEGAIDKPQQIFAGKKATQGSPVFSPDGQKIAFVTNKDGAPKIYIIDVPEPGTALKDIKATLVTRHAQESSAPAWSPDGNKLAYCAKINGTRQIWIYDFNTKEERQLTEGSGNKENPTWAPNSLSLVYNSTDAGNCELFLISINQSKATQITSGLGEKRFPCWEPK